MHKNYIFFDLDGTITDPKEGITKAVEYALAKFGIEVSDRETLLPFIGPPLRDSFKEYCGFTHEKANEAIKYYREYYTQCGGLYDCYVYPGMEKTLKTLHSRGKKIIMATAKPEDFSIQLMKHFNLDGLFDDICGASLDETSTHKEEVIGYALEKNNITDVSQVVMIGDRNYDILGAKVFNIDTVGVLYGYGSEKEFKEAGADFICQKPEDLLNIIN